MAPPLLNEWAEQSKDAMWPGPGNEVMVFSVGPALDPAQKKSRSRPPSSKLPPARSAAALHTSAPSHPSDGASASHPHSGTPLRSRQVPGRGRLGNSQQSFRPQDSTIGFFTCPCPALAKTTTLFNGCSSMPTLPSVLSAYRAKAAQEAQVLVEVKQTTVRGEFQLPVVGDGARPASQQDKGKQPTRVKSALRKSVSEMTVSSVSEDPLFGVSKPAKRRGSKWELKKAAEMKRAGSKEAVKARDPSKEAVLPEICKTAATRAQEAAARDAPLQTAPRRHARVAHFRRGASGLSAEGDVADPRSNRVAKANRPWGRKEGADKVAKNLREGLLQRSPTCRRLSTQFNLDLQVEHENAEEQIEHDTFLSLAGGTKDVILYEQITIAMTMMGYRDVRQDWVREIYDHLDKAHPPGLTFDEFKEFVEEYYHHHHDQLAEEYAAMDLDTNGKIDAGELKVYLEKCGITTVPGLVRELLKEIKGDSHASLQCIDDYVMLKEVTQCRGGFSKKEVDAMSELYMRFDADGSGKLNFRELESALHWLGFPTEEEQPDGTFQHIVLPGMEGAIDANRDLTFEEFLQVARQRREYDVTLLSQLVHEFACSTGQVSVLRAVEVFHRLGYCTASPDCIEQYAKENRISSEGVYYFDDMYLMLQTFRKSEGFLKEEIEKFREQFNTHDLDDSGAIGVVELGGMLRAMGYRADLDEQQKLMDEVDKDHSGELSFDEFLKLLRRYREDEVHALEKAFHKCADKCIHHGKLNAKEIRCLLPALGYNRLTNDQNQLLEKEAGDKELDFRKCVEMIRKLRACESADYREHQGFTEKEQKHWKSLFKAFAHFKTGKLQEDGLRSLVKDSFKSLLRDVDEKEEVDDILACHSGRHPEGSSFHESLEVLRRIEDRRSHQVILKENVVASTKGYSRAEVVDLRRMFRLCDCDASADVDMGELLQLFSTIVPMTSEIEARLKNAIQRSSKNKAEKESCQKIHFPEFLEIMCEMQEVVEESISDMRTSSEQGSPSRAGSPAKPGSPAKLMRGLTRQRSSLGASPKTRK